MELYQASFFYHNTMRLEINYRKNFKKLQETKHVCLVLNTQKVREEIKEEVYEIDSNKWQHKHNQLSPQVQEKSTVNNLILHVKQLEKEDSTTREELHN